MSWGGVEITEEAPLAGAITEKHCSWHSPQPWWSVVPRVPYLRKWCFPPSNFTWMQAHLASQLPPLPYSALSVCHPYQFHPLESLDSVYFSASKSRLTLVQVPLISCLEPCHSFLRCSLQIYSGTLLPTPNLFPNTTVRATFENANVIIFTLAPNFVKASHYF